MIRLEPNWEDEVRRMAIDERARHARDIASLAGVLAPAESGHYRRTLRVDVDGDDVRAVSGDIAGHLIEYGSINNPAFAPLRRAAEAVGLDLVKDPKP